MICHGYEWDIFVHIIMTFCHRYDVSSEYDESGYEMFFPRG